MSARAELLDSNILVYAFSTDPRQPAAEQLLARGCIISVQALNEFTNVARRKLLMPWVEVREALAAIRALCPSVLGIDVDAHERSLDIAERYGTSFFDSLMIATALQAKCGILWSEDMQDGLVIEPGLRISNPFRGV